MAAILFIPVCVAAQDAKVTASVSSNVLMVGETFNLVFTSEQQINGVELPELNGLQLLGGPSQGHSQSITSAGGRIQTTSTYQYTYFLRALKEGRYTIPPVTVRLRNREVQTNPVTLEVVASGRQSAHSGAAQQEERETQDSESAADGGDVFVTLIPDKREVYLGEQITITIKVYTRSNLSGIDQEFKGPDLTGFFIEPVEVPVLRNLEREVVNGEIYYSGVLRKAVIIPQHPGQITIKPFEVEASLRQEVSRRMTNPFFDDFFMPDVQNIPVTLSSRAVTINVKPLPAGAPESFTGAVGDFSMNTSLSKSTTLTDEPLTLRVEVSGKGNVKLFNEPKLKVPMELTLYDPVISVKMDNPFSGSKSFEYLVIANTPGDYTIPAPEFTYFNPSSGRYITLQSPSLFVRVGRGMGDSLSQGLTAFAREDVELLNQDIRYIKSRNLRLSPINRFLIGSPSYYLILAAGLAAFGIFYLLGRRRRAAEADVALSRRRRAERYARKRLGHCAEWIRQKETKKFYDELLKALWGYLSDSLSIPLSVLSKENAMLALEQKKAEKDAIEEFFRITGECEMARYAPAASNVAMDQLYKDALAIISRLHQQLK